MSYGTTECLTYNVQYTRDLQSVVNCTTSIKFVPNLNEKALHIRVAEVRKQENCQAF